MDRGAKTEPDLRTEAGLTAKRASYISELGEVVYAWNALHEALCGVFCAVLGVSLQVSAAIWHSILSDRAQRLMLEVAAQKTEFKRPHGQENILWLLAEVNKLADRRNNAVHSPYIFRLWMQDPPIAEVVPFIATGNPRAKNMANKELLVEFRWYTNTAMALCEYADKIRSALSIPEQPWPDKPTLPTLTPKKIRPDQRPRQPRG
jgi:hypothetical protein